MTKSVLNHALLPRIASYLLSCFLGMQRVSDGPHVSLPALSLRQPFASLTLLYFGSRAPPDAMSGASGRELGMQAASERPSDASGVHPPAEVLAPP